MREPASAPPPTSHAEFTFHRKVRIAATAASSTVRTSIQASGTSVFFVAGFMSASWPIRLERDIESILPQCHGENRQ